LFSLEPPADYRIQKQTLDPSPAEETDLIETFRRYGQLSGGLLPKQLDLEAFAQLFSNNWLKSIRMNNARHFLGGQRQREPCDSTD
jgi:hypothetical protein